MRPVTEIKETERHDKTPPVSIIVCAKNEAENLEAYLPILFAQDYPEFQIVVVDDCSTDDTSEILARYKREKENFYTTAIPADKKFYHGKKLAVSIGVKAAKYEHLVFTDADCYPTSSQWLKEVMQGFTEGKDIVIGHGRFQTKPGFVNLFVRFETFWNAVQYFGFALAGKPFMAVGRNLAYKKSLFVNGDVFRKHLTLASGDDDLFINSCATKTNTSVVYAFDSQTESIPPITLSDWTFRKARHLTTAPYYPWRIKWWLVAEPISRQLFWFLTLGSLFFHIFVWYALSLFFLRMILQYVILAKAAKKMGEGNLYLGAFLFDFLVPMIVAYVWIVNIFRGKKTKWK